jgi:poly-gamma-glutamate biosynthesis protein PgsC/CapC
VTALLPLSIGIGLAVSLLFTEVFGLVAGGLIVPGYLALFLAKPLHVLTTLLAAFVTLGAVRGLGKLTILYGRRRMVMTILIGYLVVAAARFFGAELAAAGAPELTIIGYIVPGLIALWLDRQGVIQTLAALLTAACVVRLVLVLVAPLELAG